MARKRTLEGFGSSATSGNANMGGALKKLGAIIGTKGVRPLGNAKGVTGGAKGGGGDVRMKPVGGKGIAGGGQGPKNMPDSNEGLTTNELGAMGKSGLGLRKVRSQP